MLLTRCSHHCCLKILNPWPFWRKTLKMQVFEMCLFTFYTTNSFSPYLSCRSTFGYDRHLGNDTILVAQLFLRPHLVRHRQRCVIWIITRDIINARRRLCIVSVILCAFDKNWNVLTNFSNCTYRFHENSVGVLQFHVEGQTDMTCLMLAFATALRKILAFMWNICITEFEGWMLFSIFRSWFNP